MKFEDLSGQDVYGGINVYRHFFDSDVDGGHCIFRVVEGRSSPKEAGKHTQPDHFHPKRDLFMVGIKGKRIMMAKGKRYVIEPGTILYIEPGDTHYSPEIGGEDWVCLELWYSAPGDEGEEAQRKRMRENAPSKTENPMKG